MDNPVDVVRQEAAKLQAEAQKKLEEAERLAKLQELYPDLRKHVGRWKKEVYVSKTVNPLVTDYESRYNCGCCSDSPLEFWPYLETPHGRVYSDPCGMFIGEKDSWTGHTIARAGWRQELEKHGIPQALIDRISHRFKEERDEAIEEVTDRMSSEAVDDPEPFI